MPVMLLLQFMMLGAHRNTKSGCQLMVIIQVLLLFLHSANVIRTRAFIGGVSTKRSWRNDIYYRTAVSRSMTRETLTMRIPIKPPQRPHSSIPVLSPAGRDLLSLSVNQRLSGKVLNIYEGRVCRKMFVDVGVVRRSHDVYYRVSGMIRLLGRYKNATFTPNQVIDVYVEEVLKSSGRLVLSLTPVFRRPHLDPQGKPYPMHQLKELKVGMALNGTIVSVKGNYAWIDAGVLRSFEDEDAGNRRKSKKPVLLMGRLYRLDLMERYAFSSEYKGAKTEALLKPGMDLQVYVKGVHLSSWQYTLTVDAEITEEKARALREERETRREKAKKLIKLEDLLIGQVRKGVITKILPGGVKLGIGAQKTGFVSIDSISEVYGKDLRDLHQVIRVGGRLEAEIEDVTDDGKIDLRCLQILSQNPSTPQNPSTSQKMKNKPISKSNAKKQYTGDDDDDDESFGYDDEW